MASRKSSILVVAHSKQQQFYFGSYR